MPPSSYGGNSAAFSCRSYLFAVLRGLAFDGGLLRGRLDAFRAVGLGDCHFSHLLFSQISEGSSSLTVRLSAETALSKPASNFLACFYYPQLPPLYSVPVFPNFGKAVGDKVNYSLHVGDSTQMLVHLL